MTIASDHEWLQAVMSDHSGDHEWKYMYTKNNTPKMMSSYLSNDGSCSQMVNSFKVFCLINQKGSRKNVQIEQGIKMRKWRMEKERCKKRKLKNALKMITYQQIKKWFVFTSIWVKKLPPTMVTHVSLCLVHFFFYMYALFSHFPFYSLFVISSIRYFTLLVITFS